ncbi:hypothetical protein D9613_007390 [Agrocybe pediades]|uniref:OV-16 antigen n=1 Tax=Agrocybe pediades TaxID=84607 RepID=A0A8H4QMF4_9AGAR|nr:hypothetical protein D9613_007390 [Agrocybe pediades]
MMNLLVRLHAYCYIMQFLGLCFLIAFCVCTCEAQDRSLSDVITAFKQHQIPEHLNINFQPHVLLDVIFPQTNGTLIAFASGKQLERRETIMAPSYRIRGANRIGPFVIIAVDPDAPLPENRNISQIRHFMGSNYYKSLDLQDPNHLVNTTEAITYWRDPRPIRSSRPHRYIFLLYKQSREFRTQILVNPMSSLAYFNVSRFAAATRLGQPIGGTFMLVGPDETSPIKAYDPEKDGL